MKYRLERIRSFAPEIWSENVDEAVRCLSAASFGPRDDFTSNLGSEPAPAKAGGECRGRLLLVTFLGEARKVTALRHEQLVAETNLHSTRPFDGLRANGGVALHVQGRAVPPSPSP